MTERQAYWLGKGFEPDLEIEVTFLRPDEGGGSGPWLAFLPSEAGEGAVVWRRGYTPPPLLR